MKLKPNHHIELCYCCSGTGKTSAHLGFFTQESLNDDPEFAEAYLDGAYDVICEECRGAGRVQVADEGFEPEYDEDGVDQYGEEYKPTREEREAAWKLRCAEDGIRHW